MHNDDDDLEKDREDLDAVHESFECPTSWVVISKLSVLGKVLMLQWKIM